MSSAARFIPRSYGGRGANYRNPCPSGFTPATMIVETVLEDLVSRNVSFLICTPSDSNIDDNSLELGLGLGLGIGIPFLLIFICYLWRCGCFSRQQILAVGGREQLINQGALPVQPITERERIFNTLGSRLHRDFLAGNLTDDLRISLRTYPLQDLFTLENYAQEHNKQNIALYIQTIIDELRPARPTQDIV